MAWGQFHPRGLSLVSLSTLKDSVKLGNPDGLESLTYAESAKGLLLQQFPFFFFQADDADADANAGAGCLPAGPDVPEQAAKVRDLAQSGRAEFIAPFRRA